MSNIALLTHAPNDLMVLQSAQAQMPEGFLEVIGINLQTLESDAQMTELLEHQLASANIIVLRVLGRLGSVPGFADLVRHAKKQGLHLIAISGTGEPDPELAAASTVSSDVLHQVQAYFQAGGSVNMAQLLRYLSDHFLLTGVGFEPAVDLPEHGIYHPDLSQDADIDDWLALREPDRASVGIVFYRAHWMSGNTRFIDALVDALEKRGLNVLPVFTSSLRAGHSDNALPIALSYFSGEQGAHIDVLINTTAFAMGEITPGGATPAGWSVSVLEQLNVPVLQAITSGMMQHQWEQSARGLNSLDAAMNVVLPEFDGRIITVPLSFKAKASGLSNELIEYEPVQDRVVRIAQIASRFARLKHLNNADKRIAFVFTNSNSKASQIGNAVGLDAPASLIRILKAMQAAGYSIGELPESGTALIHDLIDRCAYDNTYLTTEQLSHAVGRVSAAKYQAWFDDLPIGMQDKMTAQWGVAPGEAYVHDGHISLAGLELGNSLVALQPPRGYGMDPDAIYHQPDLPPTHHYYALYRWLRDEWKADAIVHVGKHGTLEWLPGKGVGLSENCFPDALLADMPLFYPFIINDPGEGAQAKRRAHAVVVDHLTPPMTTADTYGALAQLTQLVDEYYQVEVLDPAKLPLLQQQIWDLVKETNLDADLQARLLHHDHDHDDDHHGHHHHADDSHDHDHEHHCHDQHDQHDQHEHEHDDDHHHDHGEGHCDNHSHHDHAHDEHHHDHNDEHAECHHGHHHDHDPDHHHQKDGLPELLTKMAGTDVAHLIEDLDGYLCELGAAQIRDGLHILGQAPENEQLVDMLVSLTRLPNQDVPGLPIEIAKLFGLSMDSLLEHQGRRLEQANVDLEKLAGRPLPTHADVLETIEALCKRLFSKLQAHDYSESAIDQAITSIYGSHALRGNPVWDAPASRTAERFSLHSHAERGNDESNIAADCNTIKRVLNFACRELVPNLARATDEIDNLLRGLSGGYVPAGPSGSPTRGMASILPTGRNFYSVDPRSVPSQSAWRVGQQLAHEVLLRYVRETGDYPESVAISIWGTSAMRTHGDDVAQILALLGVRPVWQHENRRVTGVEVIPLDELKRPRIDVTTRISGFFRDAFPQLIDLIDDAVNAVIALDEPLAQNFVRKHYLAELGEWIGQGLTEDEASQRAAFRIFGAKPGSYGAGILPLIQEKNWQADADFAEAYVNWGGYAYGREQQGNDQRDAFRTRLSGVQVALHNQDNREHDIFDSDDYLQFHGGMIATIRALTGTQPRKYFGDSHDPSRAQVRDLKEETLRVFRSRVVNPKWLDSIRRHGYKGGLELTATVDYLFGYDATAQVMDDWMYEQVAETYAMDPEMQRFLEQANPWAQNAIAERLLEAASRGMWAEPKQQTLDALQDLYLHSETLLEARGETPRGA
ncbi:cobaltochelatase subunit CobN [Methylobacter sp.]|uniref:cobaltochelatase subunit CobN n=1 Tax=Methylobacter sp. TaxID=2051955 RepID=UPI00248755F3|nr:cobaltochelatase subunit CobN [Methylobacter sp.]MDI1277420.1 cobaltochelatase subunit CobN [Methylobacter sp.]MDI1358027.1 cobaltochelatase subunit CobN [Methylobacter sp.]